MEHVGIKPGNIHINVNAFPPPSTGRGAHPLQTTSHNDPCDILDLIEQRSLRQRANQSYTNSLMRLVSSLQNLLHLLLTKLSGNNPHTPSSPAHPPGSPCHHSGQPGNGAHNSHNAAPVAHSGTTQGSGGSSINGFSTEPQTRAYNQDETREMGKKIMQSLMKDLGISKQQAAGIVGNLMQESGLNPAINQGGKIGKPDPSAPGYGWVQWSGPRRKEYEDFARQQGLDPGSPAANYAFLLKELKGPYSGVLNNLKQTTTVADAARVIFAEYEIPGDGSLPTRVNYGGEAYHWA